MNEVGFIQYMVQIIGEMLSVIAGNKEIWIPVMLGWVAGFFFSLYIKNNDGKTRDGKVMRQSQKEMRIYGANGLVAFIVYIFFQVLMDEPFEVYISQAMLAGCVAVLVPIAWFKWPRKKK